MKYDIKEGGIDLPKTFFCYGKILSLPRLEERYLKIGNLFIASGLYDFKHRIYRWHFLPMNLNRIIREWPRLLERVERLEAMVDTKPIPDSKLSPASERPLTTLTLRKKEPSVGYRVPDRTSGKPPGRN